MSAIPNNPQSPGGRPPVPPSGGQTQDKSSQPGNEALTEAQKRREKEQKEAEQAKDQFGHMLRGSGNSVLSALFGGSVGRKEDDPTQTLRREISGSISLALNPTGEKAAALGLASFTGDNVPEQMRTIINGYVANGTFKFKNPETAKLVADEAFTIAKRAQLDPTHYNTQRIEQDLMTFIKKNGGVDIIKHVDGDIKPVPKVLAENTTYGRPISGKDFQAALPGRLPVYALDPAGHFNDLGKKNTDETIKSLGGKWQVETVYNKDKTGVKVEAGSRPDSYVAGYYVSNPDKPGQGFYLGTNEINLNNIKPELSAEIRTLPGAQPAAQQAVNLQPGNVAKPST